jgi:hypothetical protein
MSSFESRLKARPTFDAIPRHAAWMNRAVGASGFAVYLTWDDAPCWYKMGLWPKITDKQWCMYPVAPHHTLGAFVAALFGGDMMKNSMILLTLIWAETMVSVKWIIECLAMSALGYVNRLLYHQRKEL